ncbi:MAG: hypothetical protein WBC04_10955 [Candidatus Acidiferrales bacterium]
MSTLILLDCEAGHPDWLDRDLGLTMGWRDCGDQVIDLDRTLCGTNMLAVGRVAADTQVPLVV